MLLETVAAVPLSSRRLRSRLICNELFPLIHRKDFSFLMEPVKFENLYPIILITFS
jgi:hypothetical protein